MANFWQPEWYEDRSGGFLEERVERKPWALAFIVFSFTFSVVAVTRVVIGRPFDWGMLAIAVVLLIVGSVWYRIAYLSQEEIKRRDRKARRDGRR